MSETQSSREEDPLVWVGLIEYSNRKAWESATKVLTDHGIHVLTEGSLGWIEILVKQSKLADARALLRGSDVSQHIEKWNVSDSS